jgi:DMSO/TMAO reductase YedYZ molybdopterin-dependent catalytic subunit
MREMKTDKDGRILSRRAALQLAGGGALVLGLPVPFLRNLPGGLMPLAMADETVIREDFTVHGERPLNMEPPPHLLDDEVTPAARMFVRNNGQTPKSDAAAAAGWRLRIDGEVERALELSIADLRRDFETVTLRLQIECAGNGRKFFVPGTRGNQWTFGAVSCAEWTGVRLRDVLQAAGVKPGAVYTGHYGADAHLSGDASREAISRGVPIDKAMEPHNLIAFAMNGNDIPLLNGHPLRLVVPGWPGSCSQKWLTRIRVRDRVHDGEKMTGDAYRMPAYPVAPGTEVPVEDFVIIESLPVKSLVTHPRTGHRVEAGAAFEVRGHAWAGDRAVARVDVSTDFGATWRQAELARPANRYAWQRWRTAVTLPQVGYHEVWARATDDTGQAQPPVTPGWNPKGYLNNMQHRIAVVAL